MEELESALKLIFVYIPVFWIVTWFGSMLVFGVVSIPLVVLLFGAGITVTLQGYCVGLSAFCAVWSTVMTFLHLAQKNRF